MFVVTNGGDDPDAALDGVCARTGGGCTLRAAIQEANGDAVPDRDTILVDDAITNIQIDSALPTVLEPLILSGEIASGRVTIDGNDVAALTIDAGAAQQTQIFDVNLLDAPLRAIGSDVLLQDADVSGASGAGVRFGAGSSGAIGGATGHGNRIFGNGGDGVLLDAGSADVNVSHNRIGARRRERRRRHPQLRSAGAGLRQHAVGQRRCRAASVRLRRRRHGQPDRHPGRRHRGGAQRRRHRRRGRRLPDRRLGRWRGQHDRRQHQRRHPHRRRRCGRARQHDPLQRRRRRALPGRRCRCCAATRSPPTAASASTPARPGSAATRRNLPPSCARAASCTSPARSPPPPRASTTLEFSTDTACDPSGSGEGATPIAVKAILVASPGTAPIDRRARHRPPGRRDRQRDGAPRTGRPPSSPPARP